MTIHEIRKELGLKFLNHINIIAEGVYSTDEFDGNYDYGVGLLLVKFRHSDTLNPTLVMTITTIDDGVWQAYSNKQFDKNDVTNIANMFSKEFETKLPSEKELNLFFKPYGVFGTYTG